MSPKPVAITVIFTVSLSRSGSTEVPQIILASGSAASVIIWEASLISKRPRSSLPVILMMMPLAPSMLLSRSGLLIAIVAASLARLSPVPIPIPMRASPWSLIMVLTSAKSRLIIPGTVIKSEMPWIPWRRTSSAVLKASLMEVFLSIMLINLSFGTTRIASTFCFSRSMPSAAFLALTFPSKLKGFVTTAMVRAPSSLAHCAATGAAPVPVPPPMPAVTNTMSAPVKAFVRSSLDSSAACSPTSGFAPAPRPLVSFSPI